MRVEWDAGLYQQRHSFVWEHGRELVDLLAPRAGERILDAGCGTGQLTAEIGCSGALVTGVDTSAATLREARANAPGIAFVQADVIALPWRAAFDAVFSNAALHWVPDAESAARSIAGALRPGGRLVAEFGGKGNVELVVRAACAALAEVAPDAAGAPLPWFFPSIAEYAGILEREGLEVIYAVLFDRPTLLSGGIDEWLRMFGGALLARVGEQSRGRLFERAQEHAAADLFRDGQWYADYRRLRVIAIKR